MKSVFLVVPSIENLKYRQRWMNNPKTMSYNAGFDLDLKGYNKETGTISKTDEEIIEKVFNKDTIAKELLITKEMYFNNRGSGK